MAVAGRFAGGPFPSFISTPREHATFSDKIVADYAKHYSLVVTKSPLNSLKATPGLRFPQVQVKGMPLAIAQVSRCMLLSSHLKGVPWTTLFPAKLCLMP